MLARWKPRAWHNHSLWALQYGDQVFYRTKLLGQASSPIETAFNLSENVTGAMSGPSVLTHGAQAAHSVLADNRREVEDTLSGLWEGNLGSCFKSRATPRPAHELRPRYDPRSPSLGNHPTHWLFIRESRAKDPVQSPMVQMWASAPLRFTKFGHE